MDKKDKAITTAINLVEEKKKYQAELDQFIQQINQLDQQRATLAVAIAERRGILVFLNSLNGAKESGDHKD